MENVPAFEQLHLIIHILLSFVLGGLIGLERELRGRPAGIRTYALVCLGACMFGLVSTHAQGAAFYKSIADPTRIAAQIVTGVGFIGGGIIFKDSNRTRGITTAATIWTTAAIGITVAFELFILATMATVMTIAILFLNHNKRYLKWKSSRRQLYKPTAEED